MTDVLKEIQRHARALTSEDMSLIPEHLDCIEAYLRVAKLEYVK